MDDIKQLRTIKQLASELSGTGGFNEAALRWLVFNAATNGLDSAIVHVGRRVFIDLTRFNAWVLSQRSRTAATSCRVAR